MIEPYEITDPREILTEEVVTNLQIVFQQFKLSMKDIYVKLAGGEWARFPLGSEGEEVTEGEPDFCSYVRATEPFADLCSRDREACRERVMEQAGVPIQWYCPFGLRVMGIGLRVGRAEVVLRSGGWLELGNEGIAINGTLEILQLHGLDHLWSEISPLFKAQLSRTDAEVQEDAESLRGLLGLVREQANEVYQRNLERSKEDFLQEVRELVVPLMAEFDEQKQKQQMQKALANIAAFFGLEGCAFYFTRSDAPQGLTRVATSGTNMESVDRRISRSILDAKGPLNIGSARVLTGEDLARLSKPPSKACVFAFPDQNDALLGVWLRLTESSLLDDFMLSSLTRVLSVPMCVGALGTGLKHEADLRRIQARNTAHIVRSTFQGIAGDVADIRLAVTGAMTKLPANVEEPLEHMEELILYLSHLLRSHEVVEHQFLTHTRAPQLGRKRPVKMWSILTQARESFRKRANALHIDIVLDKSLRDLSPVEVDESSVSLVFVNLLHNAIKYSHSGSLQEERTIDVTGREDASNIYVDIEDFGLGIHPLEEEKVFEPYVQGSIVDERRSIAGQGIGLAAAREIARMHGGDVILERCIPYRVGTKEPVSRSEVLLCKPNSPEASELFQHCLVVFQVSLRKGKG